MIELWSTNIQGGANCVFSLSIKDAGANEFHFILVSDDGLIVNTENVDEAGNRTRLVGLLGMYYHLTTSPLPCNGSIAVFVSLIHLVLSLFICKGQVFLFIHLRALESNLP